MACMEHWCRDCDHTEFNNNPGLAKCPKCGKTFTSERGYAYVGPAKLAPYFCLECKYQLGIIFNENNDATDCDIAEWGF